MAKLTPVEQLDKAVQKILQDYANDVTMTTKELSKKLAAKGAATLRTVSRQSFRGTGKYAKGWAVQTTETRLTVSSVIYNKSPGLPHLLEKGHAKRGGGRVSGTEHIKPVEEELVEEFTKAVENDIQRSR